jgi:hypothetical protein
MLPRRKDPFSLRDVANGKGTNAVNRGTSKFGHYIVTQMFNNFIMRGVYL